MKVIYQDTRRYMLRFDKGEELMSGLVKFAKENNIQGAYFSAIGTSSTVELGYFNETLKDYRHKQFMDNWEILSLTGNIGISDGEPAIHAHGAFADNDFEAKGGHVFKMIVLATCEVFIIKLDGGLPRQMNADFNLKLLS